MIKKSVATLCLIFIFSSAAFSAAGSTGWWIFRRPQSTKPRPVTAIIGVRGDLSGVFYNPSVLGEISQKEMFFLTELGMARDTLGGLLYGSPLSIGKGAGISCGVVYYDAGRETIYFMENGDLKERTVTMQKDVLAIVSYGQKIKKELFVGGSLKFASSEIAEVKSASALGLDIGAMYYAPFYEGLVFAGGLQNFGSSTKFINRVEKLPSSVWVGSSYTRKINADSYVGGGVDVPYVLDEGRVIPNLAIEYGFKQFAVNLGYRFNTDESSIHIGFSYALKNIDIGYAVAPARYLSLAHRLNIGYRF